MGTTSSTSINLPGPRSVQRDEEVSPLDPTRTVVVLDTSVLIADPEALDGFGNDPIVLPFTVIQELNGLKNRKDEVGWAARTTIRTLRAIGAPYGGNLSSFVSRPKGGHLRVEIRSLHLDEVKDMGLELAVADNRIIAACLALKEHQPVCLVSADDALLVTAAQLGIQTAAFERHQSVDSYGDGWKEIAVDESLVGDLRKEKGLRAEFLPEILASNECAILKGCGDTIVRNSSGMLRLVSDSPAASGVRPRGVEQKFALDLLLDPKVKIVALAGHAGTGKTLLTLAAALQQVETKVYDGIGVYRPVIPAGHHDLGFLPGDMADKLNPWMGSIDDNLGELALLANRKPGTKTYREELEEKKLLECGSIAHVRGRSIAKRFLIVDEAQNLEVPILKLILTRVSRDTKIVFMGDPSQIDANYLSRNNNALTALIEAFQGEDLFGYVRLRDGQRSDVAELAANLL